MLRLDGAIARVSELICVAAGIKNNKTALPFTAQELQPWMDEPEISLDQAMKQWS